MSLLAELSFYAASELHIQSQAGTSSLQYNMLMASIYTSYFYNVRFLKPWQVPLSTACFDPRWFHDFKGPSHKFIDKRGVLNGLRAECLHPDSSCSDLCRGPETCTSNGPSACEFLRRYSIQLSKINRGLYFKKLAALQKALQAKLSLPCLPDLIFLVHEPPYKACSERSALQHFLGCQELDISMQPH